MKVTVQEIIDKKGSEIFSVDKDSTIYDALGLMAEKGIGAVLVTENYEVTGIFSERDYARKVILEGKSSKNTPVKEIMSGNVVYVTPNRTAEECMALMIDKRIRHLPVYKDNELAGLISIGDVVKAVINEKQYAIQELENYIIGRR